MATARYKLKGSKNLGERVDRVILEGSSANPVRFIDLNGEGDLTEEELQTLRADGYELVKVGEAEEDDDDDKPDAGDDKPAQGTPGAPGRPGTKR